MKPSIRKTIFVSNLSIIVLSLALVLLTFSIAARIYIEKQTTDQLNRVASRAESMAARDNMPDIFGGPQNPTAFFGSFFRLSRSLMQTQSFSNVEFMIFDPAMNTIGPFESEQDLKVRNAIIPEINKVKDVHLKTSADFSVGNTEYSSVLLPIHTGVGQDSPMGWLVLYSSLDKINQLQNAINIILLLILAITASIGVAVAAYMAKKISTPLSHLCEHAKAIANRNFGAKAFVSASQEIEELANDMNIMSEKLDSYDNAQKTFVQNASHELRTPLMSIQGYAEGIKYGVVENTSTAVDVIIQESKRLTNLVQDLLYLSRLDTSEDFYHFESIDLNDLILSTVERINGMALAQNIKIAVRLPECPIRIQADDEKLSRAIINILGNCIRYAKSSIEVAVSSLESDVVEITIKDDGPGFDDIDLQNLFVRFYKGKKGNFGLGLTITKSIIDKHKGNIFISNTETGAMFKLELSTYKEAI